MCIRDRLTYAKYTSTGNLTTSIKFVSLQGNNTMKFFTNSFADIGIHKFRLYLNDTQLSTYKDLYVEFFNNAPFFIKEVPMNLKVKFNNTFEYILPPYKDAETNNITVFLSGVPPTNAFIKLVNNETIIINATQWS